MAFCAGFPSLALSDYTNTFGFIPGTPTLIVTNAERVDFDTMRRFVFTVTATDVLDDSLVSNATVIIDVVDYNDLSPVIHNDGYEYIQLNFRGKTIADFTVSCHY